MNIVKGFLTSSKPNYQLNVTNLIKHGTRNFGRQEIVSRNHDGTLFRYTYRDSYVRMQKLANALESIGAKVGDRVGVLAWNTYQHFEIYFGLPGTGAVMVSLNLRLAPKELIYVVNHSEMRFIIVDEDLIQTAECIAPSCKTVEGYVIITDKKLTDLETKLEPVFSYEDLVNRASSTYEWPNLDENSAYAACYTTGTTGKPKGVYYSHRDIYLQAMMFAAQFPLQLKDVVFQMVPMFHVLGWSIPQAAAYVGAKLAFSGRWTLNDIDALVATIIQEKVTVSAGVPAVFMAILEAIRKMAKNIDLTGTRFICGGSEPPVSLMKSFLDLTGGEIIHSYGSTEALANVSFNKLKPWLEKEFSDENSWKIKKKQGLIVPGLDVKIVDSTGKELPHDGKASGEILLRGPWIARDYFNFPGTENEFTDDGYFKSGDAGIIDSEEYLKITDRLKDLIKSGGEWISSIDMENFLVSHPAVLEAAVVGITHPRWEERPLALVVVRDEYDKKVDKEEIREYLGKNFARWQLPDEVLFVTAVPRTSVGKIDKKAIREHYEGIYAIIEDRKEN
ncbi:MAG: long-chain-fatty-acid--CoA ligase [Candidatus Odinarchaeota archaeon]